ncbi:MAG: ABC transporter ATP-binding protein [Nitrososphaerota archaeon]|nr:ABC transporter ATP-binding protein [Nitrososphaerota archaeon]
MIQARIESIVNTNSESTAFKETLIQAKDLWKTYRSGGKETAALQGVSFNVEEGEIVCLLGPNGAGKTTLVKILSTLLLPDNGQARVMGYDVVSQADEVRKIIGYAGQDSERSAFFRLTVRENLVFFATAFHGLRKSEANERIEEMADDFDFKDCLDKYFISLSGGQKQTFVIMRSLITQPKVVFMDEPSKSLDPLTASKIRKYLKDYAQEKQAAIVVTTHNMRETEEMGNRVVMMNKGRVIFDGTPEKMRESVTKTEVIQINGNNINEEVKKQLTCIKGVISIRQENSNLRVLCEDSYMVLPIIIGLLKNNGCRPEIRIEKLTLEEAFKIMVEGEVK